GVENDLVVVEAVPLGWLVGAVDAVAVQLPRLDVGQVGVPHLVGVFGKGDAVRLGRRLGGLEQTQLDLAGVFGEQGEVDAGAVPGGAQRVRSSGPYAHTWSSRVKVVSPPRCGGAARRPRPADNYSSPCGGPTAVTGVQDGGSLAGNDSSDASSITSSGSSAVSGRSPGTDLRAFF